MGYLKIIYDMKINTKSCFYTEKIVTQFLFFIFYIGFINNDLIRE